MFLVSDGVPCVMLTFNRSSQIESATYDHDTIM